MFEEAELARVFFCLWITDLIGKTLFVVYLKLVLESMDSSCIFYLHETNRDNISPISSIIFSHHFFFLKYKYQHIETILMVSLFGNHLGNLQKDSNEIWTDRKGFIGTSLGRIAAVRAIQNDLSDGTLCVFKREALYNVNEKLSCIVWWE